MQVETVGQYQLHLIARERARSDGWDAFVEVLKFDDAAQDFKCVYERQQASEVPLASYEEAIEQARRTGNTLIAKDAM
ncbi:MAG: hypothetical protein ACM3WS_08100 [Bacillota bacterium]